MTATARSQHLADLDARMAALDGNERIALALVTPPVLAERAYRLAPIVAAQHDDPRLHALAAQVGRALEAGDLATALSRLRNLESEIEFHTTRPAEPPVPASWLELGTELGFVASRDGRSVGHALVLTFAIAAPLQREFASRVLSGIVDLHLSRLRHALIGHGLPPVRPGSVFHAERDELAPPLREMQYRTWGTHEQPPGWLVDAGDAVGVAFSGSGPGASSRIETARRVVLQKLADVIAGIEDKRPGCLEAHWARRLYEHARTAQAPNGHEEPAEALLACRALSVFRVARREDSASASTGSKKH